MKEEDEDDEDNDDDEEEEEEEEEGQGEVKEVCFRHPRWPVLVMEQRRAWEGID